MFTLSSLLLVSHLLTNTYPAGGVLDYVLSLGRIDLFAYHSPYHRPPYHQRCFLASYASYYYYHRFLTSCDSIGPLYTFAPLFPLPSAVILSLTLR